MKKQIKPKISRSLRKQEKTLQRKLWASCNIVTDCRKITIRNFYKYYFDFIKELLSRYYYKQTKTVYNHLISKINEDKILREISNEDAIKLGNHLKEKTPNSFNNYLGNLKTAFNTAKEWGCLEQNPFDNIIRRPKKEVESNKITQEQLNEIFVKMFKRYNKYDNDAIRCIASFAYHSKCKISEIINLKRKHIDFSNGIVTIESEINSTKRRIVRQIPINVGMELSWGPFIRNRVEPNSIVFSKRDGFPYSKDHIAKVFKKACRELNLGESVTLATLRHGERRD